jgi:site-specific recombinase XerD
LTSENIVKIRKFDIDLAEGEIYLMQGTRSVQRVITLNEAQIGYFSNYLQNERPQLDRFNQRCLFLNKLGDPITVNGIFRMVKPLNHFFPDRVLNPKTIRQSVTRNLSQSDKLNLVRIQQVTGHKRISSILNYRSEDMMEMRTTLLKFHPMDQF